MYTRRQLLGGMPVFATGIFAGQTTPASAQTSEDVHDAAALLDPAAYEFVIGENWSRIVPLGETWYAVNLFRVSLNQVGPFNLRRADVEDAMILPEGTEISAMGSLAFAYLCRPSMVGYGDPAAILAERLDYLRRAPLLAVRVVIPANAPPNTIETELFEPSPNGWMLHQVMSEDVSWTGVFGHWSAQTPGSMNLADEISDVHATRLCQRVRCPLDSIEWLGIRCSSGSLAGNYVHHSRWAGHGIVTYQSLPESW